MRIRVATAADAAEIARVQVAAWQVAYRGLIPDAILDTLDPQQRASRWQEILTQPGGITFVVEAESRIVGFSNLVPSRDSQADPKAIAEIAAIYVHPGHWREGIGRELCHRSLQEASKRGLSSVTLWVLNTNLSAIKFYEALGFVSDGETKTEKLNDFELHEVRFRCHL